MALVSESHFKVCNIPKLDLIHTRKTQINQPEKRQSTSFEATDGCVV